MLGFLGSILSGGATGLLGVVFQRVFDWLHVKETLKQKKVEFDHAIQMRRVDAELMDKEWTHRATVAKIEGETAAEVSANNAFAASFASEPQQYSDPKKAHWTAQFLLALIDFFRGIVRPGLTLYLCWITTLVYLEAKAVVVMVGKTLDPIAAMSTLNQVIATILYLTTTCVLWWFGTRNRQKPPGVK